MIHNRLPEIDVMSPKTVQKIEIISNNIQCNEQIFINVGRLNSSLALKVLNFLKHQISPRLDTHRRRDMFSLFIPMMYVILPLVIPR